MEPTYSSLCPQNSAIAFLSEQAKFQNLRPLFLWPRLVLFFLLWQGVTNSFCRFSKNKNCMIFLSYSFALHVAIMPFLIWSLTVSGDHYNLWSFHCVISRNYIISPVTIWCSLAHPHFNVLFSQSEREVYLPNYKELTRIRCVAHSFQMQLPAGAEAISITKYTCFQ